MGDITASQVRSGEGGLQFGHGGDAVGDAAAEGVVEEGPVRFNSATAVTPWVTWTGRVTATVCFGFNSATAVTPWVTRGSGTSTQDIHQLQFGHGGDAVGDAVRRHLLAVANSLQFGHGGDAVGDRAPLYHYVAGMWLQFGHGGDAVGDC